VKTHPSQAEYIVEGKERPAADPVTALVGLLLGSPRRVGFYRAIELLERATKGPRVGDYGPVNEEAIRFRHDPRSPSRPATSPASRPVRAARARPATGREPVYEITTTFLGLTGTVSPLPYVHGRGGAPRGRDRPAQREFLDVFHHRIMSLFYRAHARYSFVRRLPPRRATRGRAASLSLAGIDTFDDAPPPVNLSLACCSGSRPLLATRARTAQGLVAAVSDVMEEVLIGRRCRRRAVRRALGDHRGAAAAAARVANTTLGVDATIGRRVFDRGGKFGSCSGPCKRQGLPALSAGRRRPRTDAKSW
jgi:type VI secretion system protein ImpH